VDQTSPIFSLNVEGVAVDQVFQMFDMSICSRDIRDQSRKLTEIAPNFEMFFLRPPKFYGAGLPKAIPYFITPASRHIAWKKFCENTSTSPEIIRAHKLNFRPNFNFSGLNF